MRKHGCTPSRRDKHVTLAAISPPGVARGRFVGGQQSGLAGSKPPPLFTREASSCSSQGRRQGEPKGASPRPSAPTYLPGRVSPHVSMGRATCPLLWAAALGGCPAVWSISHHKGYCSRLSTVRPPQLLWLELRGHSAWQVTPSWTVYRLACHRLLPWLRVTFAMVPDAAWPGSDQWPWSTAPATGPVGRLGRPSASDPWGIGSFLSLGHPTCVQCSGLLASCSPPCPRGLLWCVCGVLGKLAPVHRCARSMCCVACAVSWATGLLFTGVRAVCGARVPWVVVSLFLPP